ncbi:MAG: hypothetical protein CSA26_03255 [Desulfobacterales bacterium]|nr:MAG: hypothetical protein CSA26_03255 [Desulfobacterales bacterium]
MNEIQAEQNMHKVKECIVQPASGGSETRWLLVIVIMIVVCCGLAIYMRTETGVQKGPESWQMNAFTELNSSEIGIFTALQTAAVEIDETHDLEDGRWLGIDEMEELYIPPFVKDSAWHKQGKVVWTRKIVSADEIHIALYRGISDTETVRGTFLLLMLHDHKKKQGNVAAGPTHAPFEIWFHDQKDRAFPDIITDQALISAGWREVVGHTGEDEELKLKGKMIQ